MWFTTLLLSHALYADKFAYSPQRISSQGITSLKVSGVKGRLIIREKPVKFYRIQVKHSKDKRYEDWNLSADRVHDALVLEVFNVSAGKQWQKMVQQDHWPEFDIELEGPSVPAVVAWRDGLVEIKGWNKSLELSFLNGKVDVLRTKGPLKLETVDAQVKVRQHQGELDLRGQKGSVELDAINAKTKVVWLNGTLKSDGLQGSYNVDWNSGALNLLGVDAVLKGTSSSAEWNIRAKAPSDINVNTASGGVKIQWDKGGVGYFLSSATGKLKVKLPCKVQARNGGEVCEGQKPGKPRGEVFVQSKTGLISW